MNMTEFEEFCKENDCLKEANEGLENIYQVIDENYPSVDCNVIDDFNNGIISIGHLEEMHDIHYCNSCYTHYGYCRMNRPHNTDDCKLTLPNDVLEKASKELDKTGDCYGVYKYVCKDILIFFRTPFVRCNEY